MIPVVECVLNAFFLASGALCVFSCENSVLRVWTTHGKQLSLLPSEDSTRNRRYRVSKQLFSHFYLVGICVNSAVFIWELLVRWEVNVFRLLFGAHMSRRFLEQHYMFNRLPASSMHFMAYLFGVCYYVVVPFSLCNPNLRVSLVHLVIFGLSQYIQFKSHCVLYAVKRDSTSHGAVTYGVPSEGPFKFLLCPHYLSEILVYVGLLCNLEMMSCLFFVTIAMTVQAVSSRQWYLTSFVASDLHTTWALVPYVL